MKIAHSQSGLRMQFTQREYELLPAGMVSVFVPPLNDGRGLIIGIEADDAGVRRIIPNPNKSHPWRLEIQRSFKKNFPYFGVEDTTLIPLDTPGAFGVQAPTMKHSVVERRPNRRRPVTAVEPASVTTRDLEGAVRSVNDIKARLRDQLVLDVTAEGFLRALVQFSHE